MEYICHYIILRTFINYLGFYFSINSSLNYVSHYNFYLVDLLLELSRERTVSSQAASYTIVQTNTSYMYMYVQYINKPFTKLTIVIDNST